MNTFEVVCSHARAKSGDTNDRSDLAPVRFAQFFSPNDKAFYDEKSTALARWLGFRPMMAEAWWTLPVQDDSWKIKCGICGFDFQIASPRLGYMALTLINSGRYVFDIATMGHRIEGLVLPAEWRRQSFVVLSVLEDSAAGFQAAVESATAARAALKPK